MHKRENQKAKDQRGMVSIIVTMIIMVVLSLVVLGFAQIARREQRQALDRQLNAQAFYAAESGINDARAAIANGYTDNKDECGPDETFDKNNVLDSDSGVEYTCLLIDQTPEKLNYTISAGDSKYAYMEFVDDSGVPTNATKITLSWRNKDESWATPVSFAPFPRMVAWGDNTGILRFTLTDLDTGYERNSLNDNSLTAFLYPYTSSDAVNFGDKIASDQGKIYKSFCNDATKYCTAEITGLDTSKVFIRLTAVYKDLQVNVSAQTATDANLSIKGAQAVVDVTGKANDVIRRVQATIPLAGFNGTSTFEGEDYAVQSVTGICKLLNVAPDFGSDGSCP